MAVRWPGFRIAKALLGDLVNLLIVDRLAQGCFVAQDSSVLFSAKT